jgi:hypothetical protein
MTIVKIEIDPAIPIFFRINKEVISSDVAVFFTVAVQKFYCLNALYEVIKYVREQFAKVILVIQIQTVYKFQSS